MESRPAVDRNVMAISSNAKQTSLDAVAKHLPKSGTKRAKCYELIKNAGMFGMCDHEIEEATGWLHQSASACRNTLMNDGWIVDSGARRLTPQGNKAIVWIAN